MKRLLVLLALMPALLASRLNAQSADTQYVAIYSTMQLADTLAENGRYGLALGKYKQAETQLKKFHDKFPEWNPRIVKFRLTYLSAKIERYSTPGGATNSPARMPEMKPPPVTTPHSASAQIQPAPAAMTTPAMAAATASDGQIRMLQEQIQRLEGDNGLLQAKLKEALSVQPAALDPRELAKAEDQIRALEKENALLKVSVSSTADSSRSAKAVAGDLGNMKKEVARLTKANAALTSENSTLQTRLKAKAPAPAADDATVAALRAENAVLRNQVAAMHSQPAAATPAGEADHKLMEAQAQIASLQSDNQLLRGEKGLLEDRLKQASAPSEKTDAALAMTDSVTAEKIRTLEAQRDELKKSLDAATRDIYGKSKGKATSARIDEMTGQLATLRARLDVLEARPARYSDEELALMGRPKDSLSTALAGSDRKVQKPLPPAAESLVSEGRKNFADGNFAKAEANFQEVLKMAPKSPETLQNLAMIEVDLKKYTDAESNLKALMQIEPQSAGGLFVLGRLRFDQDRYDEALDALSQSVNINPQDPQAQNLLGMTLGQKGMWTQAETVLRRAIQISPTYGDAHHNLAVVYISQQPPLVDLARWHYQKALEAGQPKDPNLEKRLRGTLVGTP